MLLPAQQKDFDLQVVGYSGDCVRLSLVVPSSLLPSLQTLLESLTTFVNYLGKKSAHEKSISNATDLRMIEDRKRTAEKIDSSVMLHYNAYLESGHDHRSAVQETKKHFSSLGCYSINLIIKDQKRKIRKRVA